MFLRKKYLQFVNVLQLAGVHMPVKVENQENHDPDDHIVLAEVVLWLLKEEADAHADHDYLADLIVLEVAEVH